MAVLVAPIFAAPIFSWAAVGVTMTAPVLGPQRSFAMMARLVRVLALCCSLTSTACALTQAGTWTAKGFEQTTFGWDAPFADPVGRQVIGPDWELDNWQPDGPGRSLAPKTEHSYVSKGDGRTPLYDLRFVNTHDGGVIWVKTWPAPPRDVEKDLDLVVDNLADALGSGESTLEAPFRPVPVKQRIYSVLVRDKSEIRLGPHRALAAGLETADPGKLALDPKARETRVAVVLARFYYYEDFAPHDAFPEDGAPIVDRKGGMAVQHLAVFLAGYSNRTEHFADHVPVFEKFLHDLDFGKTGPVRPDSPLHFAPPPPLPKVLPTSTQPVLSASRQRPAPRTNRSSRSALAPVTVRR